jgi:hypothetical protein
LLIKDAAKLLPDPSRRLFLRGAAGLGAITMLTGCDIVDSLSAENALMAMSRFNDRVQALIFNPNKLAPTYPESAITRPFPFNAYYPVEDAPDVDGETWMLEVGGMVENKKSWTLEELYALPQEKQITRHICIEGWSAIGKWRERRCAIFESGSVPIPMRKHMSGSSVPRAIRTPSTWPRRANADPDDVQVRQRVAPPKYGFPDEDPHTDKLNPRAAHHRPFVDRTSAAIGKGPRLQLVQRQLNGDSSHLRSHSWRLLADPDEEAGVVLPLSEVAGTSRASRLDIPESLVVTVDHSTAKATPAAI